MAEYKGPLDYIDVAARIVEFRSKHPEGSLQCLDIKFFDFAGKSWVLYTAGAYRTPDDERPGVGTAWEPVPGPTQFTRDSEVQNAETAAWGRAMVAALAVDTKKGVASKEEVRNRQVEKTEKAVKKAETVQRSAPVVESDPSTEEQRQQIKDGLEMLAPDERARFGIWWIETGYPKGVQNLSVHDANDVWSALFAILNEDNVIEGEIVIEPKRTLVEPPEPVVEATQSRLMSEPNPNGPSQKQMDFIRSLCDGMGADPYYKSSSILNKEVTSLKALTKSEAKKLVDALIAERDGAK
jgi:hypothetical protein